MAKIIRFFFFIKKKLHFAAKQKIGKFLIRVGELFEKQKEKKITKKVNQIEI